MNKGLTSWLAFILSLMFAVNLPSLQAAEYGRIPGKWTLDKHGLRSMFVPNFGYGKGVYAVQGISAEVVLALDTEGEGFAECRKVPEGQGLAEPIPDPNCGPSGPWCTAFPYRCSSELSKPLFIETNIRPTTSERLKWSNSANPTPAFKPVKIPAAGIHSFYFERFCSPKALNGNAMFQGAWLTGPNDYQPGTDESYPASVYDHYGRALYFRKAAEIKFLSEPSLNFGEASAFEPAMKDKYQWEGEPLSAPLHDEPQYYPFHKIYTVPGGYWLEIDWLSDFEGAGATTHTIILQVINGEISEFTSAQQTRMY